MSNIILNTDSYKPSHFLQYPPGTQHVESYIESRGGEFTELEFLGIQGFIKEYLLKPFTQADIDEADEVFKLHGVPFNKAGWEYILKKYKGSLPLEIRAAKEGSIIPTKNVLVTVRNTDPETPWLTSYVETALLRAIWYPTTVGTISYHIKKIIRAALIKSGGLDGLPFKLHDFGSRGVSSLESAGIGGFAHLVNFQGTDTVAALMYARKYYREPMAGFSIPAAEHSTITSWGKAHELGAYDNMIKQFAKPGSIVAIVADSYDLYNAISNMFGVALKDKIIESGATVVIRPDSGNPAKTVLRCLELLDEKFGHTVNVEGYKVLKNVRVIQGDGINQDSIKEIIAVVLDAGYSLDNVNFGKGGALLQQMNRDTLRFAMKASSITIKDPKTGIVEEREVFKSPISDFNKASKKGRQMLYQNVNTGEYITRQAGAMVNGCIDGVAYSEALEIVYRNGQIYRDQTLAEIRKIAAI